MNGHSQKDIEINTVDDQAKLSHRRNGNTGLQKNGLNNGNNNNNTEIVWGVEDDEVPKATAEQLARPFARHGRPLCVDLKNFYKFIRLPTCFEYIISVDHHAIWRRHMAWSKQDGNQLRDLMTQRYASNMVFMSLLLSAEIAVLFSPSDVTEQMRKRLVNGEYQTCDFWAGIVLCFSLFLVLSCLVCTFTAWAMVSAINNTNAHAVLRSSIGLFATQLPSRIIVVALYSFFLWSLLFMWILLPTACSFILTIFCVSLLAFMVSIYSSFGRMIMYTGAMSGEAIFDKENEEEKMLPYQLYTTLVEKATENKAKGVSVTQQYRANKLTPQDPI